MALNFRHCIAVSASCLFAFLGFGPELHRHGVASHEPAHGPLGLSGTDPEAAWDQLAQGNNRWVTGNTTHPNTTAARVADTAANGQHPIATVLACSDSRVPVEMVFDQGVGDVFTIRVAGNVADTDEIASIEYGVEHLGTPVLVVLGHTGCGAVTAVCSGAELHGSIPELLSEVKEVVDEERGRFLGTSANVDLIAHCVRANVYRSMADILRRSPGVRDRVQQGKTKLVGAIYDLATGKVQQIGQHPAEAALLGEQPDHGTQGDGKAKLDERLRRQPSAGSPPASPGHR